MDLMFEQIHPMFIRTLLLSLDVTPAEDLTEDDKDIYRTLSKGLGLLTKQTTDATLTELWARAVSEQNTHDS